MGSPGKDESIEGKLEGFTLRKARARLTRELVPWQLGALGLLALAVTVNMGMLARITGLEKAREADAVRHQEELRQAEHMRDLAVRELGNLRIQWAEEQANRAAQAAAYEAIGAYRYVGECTVTYYCPCEECCGKWADGLTATGLPAGPGVVAVDPEVIPMGSTVIIDGQRYLAADTGVTGKHVDICLAEHEATVEAGVRTAEVWVISSEEVWNKR